MVEFGAEAPEKVALKDTFYSVPSDLEMVGYILNGLAAKRQYIAFKGPGVGWPVGKSQLDLAHDIAAQTLNALDGQLNKYRY